MIPRVSTGQPMYNHLRQSYKPHTRKQSDTNASAFKESLAATQTFRTQSTARGVVLDRKPHIMTPMLEYVPLIEYAQYE